MEISTTSQVIVENLGNVEEYFNTSNTYLSSISDYLSSISNFLYDNKIFLFAALFLLGGLIICKKL